MACDAFGEERQKPQKRCRTTSGPSSNTKLKTNRDAKPSSSQNELERPPLPFFELRKGSLELFSV